MWGAAAMDDRKPGWDDDELMAELALALRAPGSVPLEFAGAGQLAFTWLNIDDELADLTYDSAYDGDRAGTLTRDESAPLRALTYSSPELTFELEITDEAVHGQIVPCQVLDVQVLTLSGEELVVTTDQVGCFTLRPIPRTPFYLRCHTGAGIDVVTNWIAI